jgi:hypothetical protein
VNSPKHGGDSFKGVIIISIPTNDLSFKPFSVSVNVNNGHSHLPIFVSSETKKTIQSIPTVMSIPNNPISGWWYTYPSEKYEFVRLDQLSQLLPNYWGK